MRRRNTAGVGSGASTLVMIFVLLCLVIFACLTLVTASGDSRLSRKLADRTTEYYAACNLAEEKLADIRRELQAGTVPETSYVFPVSDSQELQVEIALSAEEGGFSITRWQVVSTQVWEADDSLSVWGAD